MEPQDLPPKHSPPRKIAIANADFGFGNIEAWANIIRSYQELHPGHRVTLLYQNEPVPSLTKLFKLGHQVDHEAFQVTVTAQDQDFKHLRKLHRLLVEGAGADFQKFLVPELHRTLKLF